MTPRAAIVLPSGPDGWRVANLSEGFVRVGDELARGGFAVELVLPPGGVGTPALEGRPVTRLGFTNPPIVAGPAPAHLSLSLRQGHQLWRHLAADPPDIVFAPLLGGVLQPSLMSRALAESLTDTVMCVWGEAGTAERVALGDIEPAGVGALIDDAMESTTLSLVDAVAAPRGADGPPRRLELALPANATTPAISEPQVIDEIVFVGPGSGRHGAPAFLTAIERLGHAGALADRRVTFLGPWRVGPKGIGKEMLGRRARDWRFAFTQSDACGPDAILAHLRRPSVLAVFAGAAADDDVLVADAAAAGVRLAVCEHHPLAGGLGGRLCRPDLADLADFLEPGSHSAAAGARTSSWSGAFEALVSERRAAASSRPARQPSASLCITHRNRPAALAAAVASRGIAMGPALDTIVVDTGSDGAALTAIAGLERQDVRIINAPSGSLQPWARNLAAERSAGDILVFLDDDNLFIDDGLSRLVAAFANPQVDIVVSTLSLYDCAPGQGHAAADLVFMGQTGLAGLLFNGFGDANFAIRRDAFWDLGGFADNDVAGFDWVFLARAQGRGLIIGVLQKPAIGYRREMDGRDTKWRKHDLEEPRRHVVAAYELSSPVSIMAALAQSLSLPAVE